MVFSRMEDKTFSLVNFTIIRKTGPFEPYTSLEDSARFVNFGYVFPSLPQSFNIIVHCILQS
jgi:hypothetical protein